MILNDTRVFVNLIDGTRHRGKLNGNYEGSGPVSIFNVVGEQLVFPAERIAYVEERPERS